MAITRRFFIGGAAAFGAFGGLRLVGAPNFRRDGKPNLRFGVMSDIHIRYVDRSGREAQGWGSNATFRRALEWFRAQNVDAVVIAGDMADYGLTDDLEAVVQAWQDVFPNNRYPDGRPVEKVFIYGNHDFLGYLYGNAVEKRFPDEKERVKHILRADLKGNWRKFFHEDYSRLYAKEIKGYRFIAQHWDDGTGMETRYGWGEGHLGEGLDAYFKAHGKAIDPSRPFFYVQHPHLKDTCYGSWAWGHDNGGATRALSSYPNAIALSGHSHYSLTDERSVWQGAFTSVGTASLLYTGLPFDECAPGGQENAGASGKDAWRHNAAKLSPMFWRDDCRQGMLWSVYDDCIVIRRREMLSGLDVGDDWVMPLPAAESKPFAFAERARKLSAPRFADGAKLEVERTKARNRGGKSPDGKESVPSVEKDAYRISIPPVAPDKSARAFEFEVVAESKGGEKRTKFVMAEGFNHALTHKRATRKTSCAFALDELPKGEVRFVVTPMNCFHGRGASLASEWIVV